MEATFYKSANDKLLREWAGKNFWIEFNWTSGDCSYDQLVFPCTVENQVVITWVWNIDAGNQGNDSVVGAWVIKAREKSWAKILRTLVSGEKRSSTFSELNNPPNPPQFPTVEGAIVCPVSRYVRRNEVWPAGHYLTLVTHSVISRPLRLRDKLNFGAVKYFS